MATLPSQRPPNQSGLPGRDVRPRKDEAKFPPRSTSYRALSIIDAYGVGYDTKDLPKVPDLPRPSQDVPKVVREPDNGAKSSSYLSSFDVDEAYGSGEAEIEADTDDYDPFRPKTPPLRTPKSINNLSSRGAAPVTSTTSTPSAPKLLSITRVEKLPEQASEPGFAKQVGTSGVTSLQAETRAAPPLPAKDMHNVASSIQKMKSMLELTEDARRASSQSIPALPPKTPADEKWALLSKSTTAVNLLGNLKPSSKDKALPTVPRKQVSKSDLRSQRSMQSLKLPAPQKDLPSIPLSKDRADLWKGRKDSVLGSDRGSTSAASSPMSRLSPTAYDLEQSKKTSKRSLPPLLPLEEAAARASRGIRRDSKPAPFALKRSNGSTAESMSSVSTNQSDAPSLAQLVPMMTASPTSVYTTRTSPAAPASPLPPAAAGHVAAEAVAAETTAVATTTATATATATTAAAAAAAAARDPLPISNSSAADTSSPLASTTSHPVPPDNAASGDDESESDMHRIKNLVKRRPVGATPSNHKENQRVKSPKKAIPTNPYRTINQNEANAAESGTLSPASRQSLEPFPLLENQSSSDTTIHAPVNAAARSASPPALLRSPSPLSKLDESPSRYGLKKKSEKNLRQAGERQSQLISPGNNGIFRFHNAQKSLKDTFVEDPPTSPLHNPRIVSENEIARIPFYHASLLNCIPQRPRDSNAPQLSTVQLHCYNDHSVKWHSNSNEIHPVNCALCDADTGARWSCCTCGLRVCAECMEKVKARMENTAFKRLLREVQDEHARLRAQFESTRRLRNVRSNTNMTERTITPSRGNSPSPYNPYSNPRAISSTHSLPGAPGALRGRPSHENLRGPISRLPMPPYGRPPGHGHRPKGSFSNNPGGEIPPTPAIPEQYQGEMRSSKGSDAELRGRRRGESPYGREKERGRHGSAARNGAKGRSKSAPRGPPGMSRAELLGAGGGGAYPAMPSGMR